MSKQQECRTTQAYVSDYPNGSGCIAQVPNLGMVLKKACGRVSRPGWNLVSVHVISYVDETTIVTDCDEVVRDGVQADDKGMSGLYHKWSAEDIPAAATGTNRLYVAVTWERDGMMECTLESLLYIGDDSPNCQVPANCWP